MPDQPRLAIARETAMVDSAPEIRVTGCPPHAPVTVRAHVDDPVRGTWRSEPVYEADVQGAVELAAARPMAGGYATVDPFGLPWSLARDPASVLAAGFAAASEPFEVELTAEVDGALADRSRIRRSFIGPGVAREPVRDRGLAGTVFASADRTRRPPVLVVGGSDGARPEGIAALLASHGFAALALAYFGVELLPSELVEIPLEYFETAIDWLRSRPDVAPDRLGVLGRSRGGEVALLLGATFSAISAVVAATPRGASRSRPRRTTPAAVPQPRLPGTPAAAR